MTDYRRIVLRSVTRELDTGKFNTTVKPGMILDYADGDTSEYRPHSSAGGQVTPLRVAEINYLEGNGVSDDYSEDDKGPVAFLRPADIFVGILSAGEDFTDGDRVVSNGDGTLKKQSSEENEQAVGIMKENVDLSDTGAEDTRAKVEVA